MKYFCFNRDQFWGSIVRVRLHRLFSSMEGQCLVTQLACCHTRPPLKHSRPITISLPDVSGDPPHNACISAATGYVAPPIPRLFSGLYGCLTPPSRKLNYALKIQLTTPFRCRSRTPHRFFFGFRRHGCIKQPINALNRQIAATSCTWRGKY